LRDQNGKFIKVGGLNIHLNFKYNIDGYMFILFLNDDVPHLGLKNNNVERQKTIKLL